ncbi:hypothetical protein AAFN60_09015 [Roseibacillus persicicus]|uniref:hypothetical protein n=1 Tax=Roseibacillus persicicus TaxID=454148 RepID=UPI00398B1EB7
MSQSPELAGGEGFTFEGAVAAFYLRALFADEYAPGISDRRVVGVSVQQRDFGEPLDDVVVDFSDGADQVVRLSLQAKQSLTISGATTNHDFREVIRDSWLTLHKPEFRRGSDRYGVATEKVALDKERTLRTLCDYARASLTTEHFHQRFSESGNANAQVKQLMEVILGLLEEYKGCTCSKEELHRFLAHFVLVRLDLMREGAAHHSEALNSIRNCLANGSEGHTPLVWQKFNTLAREHSGRSGQFDRASLLSALVPLVRLKGSSSMRADAETIRALAQSNVARINDDIGGVKLERIPLRTALAKKLEESKFLQVRGLPGSGKSVFVRRLVHDALSDGPVLFF